MSFGRDPVHVAHGVVAPPAKLPREKRLLTIFEGLGAIIAQYAPHVASVEEPFVAANVRSAFAIGEARAAAMLAIAHAGLELFSYSPAAVKETVVGYGRGEKAQVQEMVRLQLRLKDAPQPFDAADALALALCHGLRARIPAR